MHRKFGMVLILGLALGLSGCSQSKITTTKETYKPNQMVAVIKGHTSNHNHVTYQIDNGKTHQATVNDNTFIIEVPASTQNQHVKIKAKHGDSQSQKTVTVRKTKKLGNYQQVSQKYNQMVVMSKLSSEDQKSLQTARAIQKNAKTAMNAQAMAQLQQVQVKISQLQQQTKDLQLPTKVNSIQNVIKQKAYTLRLNVQDNQLIGATMMIPMSSLKNKKQAQQFGTSFVLLSESLGANGKKVMQKFEDETKNEDKTQTTLKTIIQDGVKYSIGFSKTTLYIYITKA